MNKNLDKLLHDTKFYVQRRKGNVFPVNQRIVNDIRVTRYQTMSW